MCVVEAANFVCLNPKFAENEKSKTFTVFLEEWQQPLPTDARQMILDELAVRGVLTPTMYTALLNSTMNVVSYTQACRGLKNGIIATDALMYSASIILGLGQCYVTQLDLSNIKEASSRSLEAVIRACSGPQLRSVSVAGTMADEALCRALIKLERLEQLSLANTGITEVGLMSIAEFCVELVSLDISRTNATLRVLNLLERHCPRLQFLDVSFCRSMQRMPKKLYKRLRGAGGLPKHWISHAQNKKLVALQVDDAVHPDDPLSTLFPNLDMLVLNQPTRVHFHKMLNLRRLSLNVAGYSAKEIGDALEGLGLQSLELKQVTKANTRVYDLLPQRLCDGLRGLQELSFGHEDPTHGPFNYHFEIRHDRLRMLRLEDARLHSLSITCPQLQHLDLPKVRMSTMRIFGGCQLCALNLLSHNMHEFLVTDPCPSLSSLKIPLDYNRVQSLLECFPNLFSLEYVQLFVEKEKKRRLVLSRNRPLNDHARLYHPKLRVLQLDSTQAFPSLDIVCPQLERFMLGTLTKTKLNLESCTKLRCVRLRQVQKTLWRSHAMWWSTPRPELETLEWMGCPLTDITPVLNELPSLRHLRISCSNVHALSLKSTSLESLNASNCMRLRSCNVQCPNLHTLNVGLCENLCDLVVEHKDVLKEVNCERCSSLSVASVTMLKALPLPKVIDLRYTWVHTGVMDSKPEHADLGDGEPQRVSRHHQPTKQEVLQAIARGQSWQELAKEVGGILCTPPCVTIVMTGYKRSGKSTLAKAISSLDVNHAPSISSPSSGEDSLHVAHVVTKSSAFVEVCIQDLYAREAKHYGGFGNWEPPGKPTGERITKVKKLPYPTSKAVLRETDLVLLAVDVRNRPELLELLRLVPDKKREDYEMLLRIQQGNCQLGIVPTFTEQWPDQEEQAEVVEEEKGGSDGGDLVIDIKGRKGFPHASKIPWVMRKDLQSLADNLRGVVLNKNDWIDQALQMSVRRYDERAVVKNERCIVM